MKLVLAAALLLYLGYAVLMIVLHPRFIYPFQPDDRVLPGFSRVELQADDGTPIFVQERPGTGPVVLYLMGNAGSVPLFETAFGVHIAADRHVIALEYRGGAGRPGTPSEARLKADALVAADYALRLDKPLIVQGFSLGTGLATFVAANRAADRVVLSAPYDKLCRLMAERAWLPACVLPFVQRWNSMKAARNITVPILVMHGTEDAFIPPIYSASFEELPNTSRVLIGGAAHNDINAFPTYGTALRDFLAPLETTGS